MKILVTGSLGFIGSHLVERLKEGGHYVVGMDNESFPAISEKDSPADETWLDDVRDTFTIPDEFDFIFHLASPVGVLRVGGGSTWDIIEAGQEILWLAQEIKAKLIAFSTSEVYGPDHKGNLKEADRLCVEPSYDSRSGYQIGKIAMECMMMASDYKDVQIVRPFNVVGPRQRADGGFVLPRLVEQAKTKNSMGLSVFFDGEQKRAFIHVSDVVDFLMLLMEKWPEEKGIWNLSHLDNVTSIKALAYMVRDIAGSGINIKFHSEPHKVLGCEVYREAPPKVADISKALALGWEPKIGLREIVEEVLRDD